MARLMVTYKWESLSFYIKHPFGDARRPGARDAHKRRSLPKEAPRWRADGSVCPLPRMRAHQRIGHGYMAPPWFHNAFVPRCRPSLLSLPTLRSNTSL